MNTLDKRTLLAGNPPQSEELVLSLLVDNSWLKAMREYCLEPLISSGGCKVKILYGDSGTGKTHYLKALESYAKKFGFYVCNFDMRKMEYRLTDLIQLYKGIATYIDTQALRNNLLLRILEKLGYHGSFHQIENNSLVDFICEQESAPVYMARQTIRKNINLIVKNLDISFSFRLFLGRYMEAICDNDAEYLLLLESWLMGIKLASFDKRRTQLFESLNRQNARVWLYSFNEVIRLAGYKGMVLILDQFESILPDADSAIRYTNLKRNDTYEMLRQLIDDLDFLRHFLLLIAGNTNIVTSEKYGLQSYHALWMRVQQNYVQEQIINPYSDVINANLIMKQIINDGSIGAFSAKLREICLQESCISTDTTVKPSTKIQDFKDIIRHITNEA